MTTKFEVGKTYATRSACDYDSWFRVIIKSRTEKTVVTERGAKRIRIIDGVETIKPLGSYSMAPCIWANAGPGDE
jgi:hypothetical protein